MKLNFLKEAGLLGLSDEPSVRLFISTGDRGQSLNPEKEADRKDKVFRAGKFPDFMQFLLKRLKSYRKSQKLIKPLYLKF